MEKQLTKPLPNVKYHFYIRQNNILSARNMAKQLNGIQHVYYKQTICGGKKYYNVMAQSANY